jgi:DNA-binding transcriptional LysR family regulator
VIADIRVRDLTTFLAVRRLGTMAAAARELRVTPSQVTKAVARLEAQLGVRLVARGGRNAALTDAGGKLAPSVEALVDQLTFAKRAADDSAPTYAFAATSYLYDLFLPRLGASVPDIRLRGAELPAAILRALMGEQLFDLALMTEKGWPAAHWTATEIGEIRSGLFGSPELARELGHRPVKPERVRELTFIGPVYVAQNQLHRGEDFCPLAFAERRFGHEVQTIRTGLELAAATRHVVFGPVIAAGPFVRSGQLKEIRVEGWSVSAPLYLAVNGNTVLARVQRALVAALKSSLKELETAAR